MPVIIFGALSLPWTNGRGTWGHVEQNVNKVLCSINFLTNEASNINHKVSFVFAIIVFSKDFLTYEITGVVFLWLVLCLKLLLEILHVFLELLRKISYPFLAFFGRTFKPALMCGQFMHVDTRGSFFIWAKGKAP